MELLLISLASLAAGFVDSIVGGGGLILLFAIERLLTTLAPVLAPLASETRDAGT
mgnify:CR=1 FL=1